MLRKIEYLIPAALEAIDSVFKPDIEKDGIASGYQSAISGFGASLLQMGLLPTISVYEDEGSDAAIVRKNILRVLVKIVLHKDSRFSAKDRLHNSTNSLIKRIANDDFPQNEFKESLIKASIAFKLAIRTYKLKKS